MADVLRDRFQLSLAAVDDMRYWGSGRLLGGLATTTEMISGRLQFPCQALHRRLTNFGAGQWSRRLLFLICYGFCSFLIGYICIWGTGRSLLCIVQDVILDLEIWRANLSVHYFLSSGKRLINLMKNGSHSLEHL